MGQQQQQLSYNLPEGPSTIFSPRQPKELSTAMTAPESVKKKKSPLSLPAVIIES